MPEKNHFRAGLVVEVLYGLTPLVMSVLVSLLIVIFTWLPDVLSAVNSAVWINTGHKIPEVISVFIPLGFLYMIVAIIFTHKGEGSTDPRGQIIFMLSFVMPICVLGLADVIMSGIYYKFKEASLPAPLDFLAWSAVVTCFICTFFIELYMGIARAAAEFGMAHIIPGGTRRSRKRTRK